MNKKLKLLITLIIPLTFLACNNIQKKNSDDDITFKQEIPEDKKLFDFKVFSLVGPKHWVIVKKEGIDSYVSAIALGKGDTVEFDYGNYSNPLTENPIVFSKKLIPELLNSGLDTSDINLVDNIESVNLDEFRLNNYKYEKISGYNAKIVSPKVTGKGLTGVYFDSIGKDRIGNIHLSFYGIDLNENNQNEFLNAIRTIRIIK